MLEQRIFSYGTPVLYCFQATAIIAACGSGVAAAMVNLVLGNFITLLSDASSGRDVSSDFMSLVSEQSYVLRILRNDPERIC
jgi:ATP-binding cassette subfamily B (MDR/TAP) protein 1